ncbi:hypothetical protein F511_27191 [Dorcoceras hygrometricum]|uniref:UBL3-like ubiquitin domain-containing protein n=1 Tax=Dorcoceras hygrometricum TaxID=472368 RepID=A0A2Z7CEV2_9LAMI|nr:hypothetical protein F511_27191 [Dorcoceras hygrometricum]
MFLLDKPIRPTSVHDIKLVNAGQVLGDGRTLAESRVCVVPGEVTTMLVNVQPPEARRRPGICRFLHQTTKVFSCYCCDATNFDTWYIILVLPA